MRRVVLAMVVVVFLGATPGSEPAARWPSWAGGPANDVAALDLSQCLTRHAGELDYCQYRRAAAVEAELHATFLWVRAQRADIGEELDSAQLAFERTTAVDCANNAGSAGNRASTDCEVARVLTRRNELLAECVPSACPPLSALATGPQHDESTSFVGLLRNEDPLGQLMFDGSSATHLSVNELQLATGARGGYVTGSLTIVGSVEPSRSCGGVGSMTVTASLSGEYVPPHDSFPGVFAGTALVGIREQGDTGVLIDDQLTGGAARAYWVATQQPGTTRVDGTLIRAGAPGNSWNFVVDSKAPKAELAREIAAAGAPVGFPTPVTSSVPEVGAASVAYATTDGVFVVEPGSAPIKLASIPKGARVYSLAAAHSGRLLSWTTDSVVPQDNTLSVADLTNRRLDTWDLHAFEVGRRDTIFGPPRLTSGDRSLLTIFGGSFVRISPKGLIDEMPIQFTPHTDPTEVGCYQGPSVLAEINGTVLLEAQAVGGPGWGPTDLYRLGSDGSTAYLATTESNAGVSDVVSDPSSDGLFYSAGWHGGACESGSSITRLALASDNGQTDLALPLSNDLPTSVDSITRTNDVALATVGTAPNMGSDGKGACVVPQDDQVYEIAKGDLVTPLGIKATWASAGTNGTVVYIDYEGNLRVRSGAGDDQLLASAVSAATYVQ